MVAIVLSANIPNGLSMADAEGLLSSATLVV